MANLFGGISGASKSGGRIPFFSQPGVYLCRLRRFTFGSNRKKFPFAQVEVKVLHVLGECPNSDVAAWGEQNPGKALKMEPHKPGVLLANRTVVKPGDMENTFLGEIRAMAEAAVESHADADGEDLEAWLADQDIEWSDDPDDDAVNAVISSLGEGDGTEAAGALYVVTTDARVNANKTMAYTVNGFVCGNSVARELIGRGELQVDLEDVAEFLDIELEE